MEKPSTIETSTVVCGSKSSLFALSSSLDNYLGEIGESMMRVNIELKKHAPPAPCSPQSLLHLSHMIREEEALQSELELKISTISEEMGKIWKTLLELPDDQSRNTAEMIGLKLSMVDYDMKCRRAGMESASAFPRKRLGELRKKKRHLLQDISGIMGMLWRVDVVIACLILFSSVAFGWLSIFWGMLSAGVLFFLAGVVRSLCRSETP